MSENALTAQAVNTPARTLDEIRISFQIHTRSAALDILEAGRDLIEAKAVAGHGGWLPFLKSIGCSASTAENWMRLSREISPDSSLATLPYTKALALLAVPAEEREAFAQDNDVDSKTAAQIKKLIEERNRAAEAANAETHRANQAEETIKILYETLDERDKEIDEKCMALCDESHARIEAQDRAKALEKQLDELVNNPKTVPVETVPADYEQMKNRLKWADQNVDDAMKAAMDAQKRADELEKELAQLRMNGGQREPEGIDALAAAVNRFIGDTQLMIVNPGPLAARERDADALIRRMSRHVIELQQAVFNATLSAEGAVV